ncbi:MAG: lysophospholipid acyltransferase family protein [bacterium]
MSHALFRHLYFPLFHRRIRHIDGLNLLPQSGGFLIAANHIDYLDGFFLAAAIGKDRPRSIAFLSETANYWWIRGVTIPVDPSQKAAALDRALAALERGIVIGMFPEGRRNTSHELLQGKTGIARLAAWSGLPVLPIGIVGSSSRNFMGSVTTLLFRHRPVTIRIGEPLTFPKIQKEEITKPQLVAMTTTIMQALGRVCGKSYHPLTPTL